MSQLTEIQDLTVKYADDYSKLTEYVTELNDEMERLKRSRVKRIKVLVQRCVESKEALKAAIDSDHSLFVKPRTHVFSGMKVGLQKAKGKLDWEDDDKVVELIEKKLPDQAEILIITKKIPNCKALENLDVKELKSIGVSCVEAGDKPYIKPVDSNVDKLVAALLKDASDELEGEG